MTIRQIPATRFAAVAAIAASSLAAVSPARAQDPLMPATTAATATSTAEAAPSNAAPAAAADTNADRATIVFYRPKKFMGAGVGFKVREGETELGKLRNGKYFVLKVSPGVHEYVVHSETRDVLTLEAEAGQTYYVEGTMGMGVVAARPNLAPASADAFEAIKAGLKEVEPLAKDDAD